MQPFTTLNRPWRHESPHCQPCNRSRTFSRQATGIVDLERQWDVLARYGRFLSQLRLRTALQLAPERTWTITELARATGVPQPSASREVARLGEAGIESAFIYGSLARRVIRVCPSPASARG